ncbi:MAG: sigma-70 family RNA polymerase sigma factor [Bacilli bacterium]|nr:sigma-70 family RNA polymerase sigma factor [Bacilli bacterium]
MNDIELSKIIKENKGLICQIISKYTKYYEFEDLYQISVIGIIKAYKNYNKNSNAKFTTYAYKYILSEVINYVNNSKLIKTSRKYNSIYKKILEAKNILTQRLMKEPTNYELSLFLEIDENIINDIMNLKENVNSLDYTLDNDIKIIDNVVGDNDINIDNILLKEGLNKLDNKELELINLRYFKELTQEETAKYLKTNQVQVSRNESKILKKLKNSIC